MTAIGQERTFAGALFDRLISAKQQASAPV
jgi:hypothetical protein